MKVKVNSKKGLKTNLSVVVDKLTIQKKMDEEKDRSDEQTLKDLDHKLHLLRKTQNHSIC